MGHLAAGKVMTLRIAAITALLFITLHAAPSRADDWASPEPIGFHARGMGLVAEIFPPGSRNNPTAAAACFFYEMGYPGGTWKIDAKLRWKGTLVAMPVKAVVSMEGHLVTLDEHGRAGYANALVVYDPTGHLVATYALDELLPKGDNASVHASSSSRWWNEDAKYWFVTKPSRLYVELPSARAIEVALDKVGVRYDVASRFPDLARVSGNPNANERTEVWQTRLRFSSVTDVARTPPVTEVGSVPRRDPLPPPPLPSAPPSAAPTSTSIAAPCPTAAEVPSPPAERRGCTTSGVATSASAPATPALLLALLIALRRTRRARHRTQGRPPWSSAAAPGQPAGE